LALGKKIFKHSAVYTVGSFLDQSIGLILLPIYTRVLTKAEVGIIAVSHSIGMVMTLLLAMGMHGAASRLYFDYRGKPKELKEFWGTVFVFLTFFSGGAGLTLAIFGEPLFRLITAGVAFRPFIVLALITATLTPFINTYLRTLQARQQPVKFVILNSSRFLFTMMLVIFLVVGLKMGAKGPLLGFAVVSGIYWILVAFMLSKDVTYCFKWRYLRHALGYSLPIVPASVSSKVGTMADRLILNGLFGSGSAGLYHIGYAFGNVIQVIALAVNNAFSPVFRDAMQTHDKDKLVNLRNFSLFIVYGYCVIGMGLSLFAREIVAIVTGREFHSAYVVVPFIGLAFVCRGVYFVFSSVLQYFRITLWYGFLISIFGMVVSISLNLRWIPVWGMTGAGMAAMSTQIVVAILAAVLTYRYARVHWPYVRFTAMVICTMVVSLPVSLFAWKSWWFALMVKLLVFPAMTLVLSAVAWGDFFHIFKVGKKEAARLFCGWGAELRKKR